MEVEAAVMEVVADTPVVNDRKRPVDEVSLHPATGLLIVYDTTPQEMWTECLNPSYMSDHVDRAGFPTTSSH